MKEKYEATLSKVELARSRSPFSQNVDLIAVSKGQSFSKMKELYELGHRNFGENYVQELLEKKLEFEKLGIQDICFHFMGHLQTNKVKQLLGSVDVVHSLDSIRLAYEIEKACVARGRILDVFVEVNIDDEESKFGFKPHEVLKAVSEIQSLPHLNILGLMAIPNPTKNLREAFFRTRALSEAVFKTNTKKISMGMSEDFEIAIEEGSTCVRVGTAIFGPRIEQP